MGDLLAGTHTKLAGEFRPPSQGPSQRHEAAEAVPASFPKAGRKDHRSPWRQERGGRERGAPHLRVRAGTRKWAEIHTQLGHLKPYQPERG